MKRLLFSRRGETLVEVMCSMVLLVLSLGILLGAVRFSSSALHREKTLEHAATQLRRSLRDAQMEGTEVVSHTFSDPSRPEEPAFTVDVRHCTKTVEYTAADGTQQSLSFLFFAPAEGGAP